MQHFVEMTAEQPKVNGFPHGCATPVCKKTAKTSADQTMQYNNTTADLFSGVLSITVTVKMRIIRSFFLLLVCLPHICLDGMTMTLMCIND